MLAELKHIWQPKPQPTLTTPTISPGTDKARKRTSSGRRGKKVTNRGDKPRSKQSRKLTTSPSLPPPPHCNHPEEAGETSITYSWMMVWKNSLLPLLKVGKRNHIHHPQGQDHRPVDKLQAEINVTNLTSNSSWKIFRMETNFLIL